RERSAPMPMPSVTVELPEVESAVLANNPLGDSTTRRLPVLLPPGYTDSDRRYPVLVGLAGFTGRGIAMLNDDPWQPNLAQRLERLYAQGMPHVIAVLPDGFTRYGGSQYLNSSATGRYEDYIAEEIVRWVDARYRTIAAPEGRGIFGKSSGGFGALTLRVGPPQGFGRGGGHNGGTALPHC